MKAVDTLIEAGDIPPFSEKHSRMLDVRSEIEWSSSLVPAAVNIPILSTSERSRVGLCYREQGAQAAISLGHDLVSGLLKESRIRAWVKAVEERRCSVLYCARGGMRSEIAQNWLHDAGVDIPRVRGGYKAIRRTLLDAINKLSATLSVQIVTGQTGSGKTELLRALAGQVSVVDLELHAGHRGSSFGRTESDQPAQATFENCIAADIVECSKRNERIVFVEDESRAIGGRVIPEAFFQRMTIGPLIVLQASLQERTARIHREYVEEPLALLEKEVGSERAVDQQGKWIRAALDRIRRALGGVRFEECANLITRAFEDEKRSRLVESHADWIGFLLREYYDPYYTHHIEKNRGRIIFEGVRDEVVEVVRSCALVKKKVH